MEFISIKNARSNNLKNIDIEIPRNKFVVISGPSGSGKSSLAFETIFKEGQRRFLESISSYGRSFLQTIDFPKVDLIEGLSPTVAIDQKTSSINPRSTVGTLTEIYTYLRMLYAKLGTAHSPESGKEISPLGEDEIIKKVLKLPKDSKLIILSPILMHKKGEHRDVLQKYENLGFTKIRVNKKHQFIDEKLNANVKQYNNVDLVIDRVKNKKESKERIINSIKKAILYSKGSVVIETEREDLFLSNNYYCPELNKSFPKLDESLFSFNSPRGYCEYCLGLGEFKSVKEDKIFIDHDISLKEGPLGLFIEKDSVLKRVIINLIGKSGYESPLSKLPKAKFDLLINGKKNTYFRGIIHYINLHIEEDGSDHLLKHLIEIDTCSECEGYKLNSYANNVTIMGLSIGEVCNLSIEEFYDFVLKLDKKYKKNILAQKILKEIIERTKYLNDIGLYYLTINRKASTLSGGEFQRIRLSSQLGSMMSGLVYVLDEPSIGLHQRDNQKIIKTLKKLQERDNTVIVVEHDEETMEAADHIIDIGPRAGFNGGEVVFEGKVNKLKKCSRSITGNYLSGKKKILITEKRKQKDFIELKGATENNLVNQNLKLPLENFICITGVSGSGKSTLINKVFIPAMQSSITRRYPRKSNFKTIKGYKNIQSLISIDQSPIGRTPKSIPLTYCGIFSLIRNIFANTNEAKLKGFKAGNFSFNTKSGQCENCSGNGYVKLEMPFLSEVYNKCSVCEGKRYNNKVLDVYYRDMNIYDVLELSVDEGIEFFKNHKKIHLTLKTLHDVGLGYLKLGQPSPSLSGGEAQRIKLSRELSKIKKGKCLYILDEPTTGLHFKDIQMLIDSLQKLVNLGHTVIVIEHNLDVVKCSDFIVDLGPEGGKHGGIIIYQGKTEGIIKIKKSITGKFLRNYL